jgi:hypothetical protein
MMVTDEDHLGTDPGRLVDDCGDVTGAGHRCFVDHDNGARRDLALLDEMPGNRGRRDAGPVLEFPGRSRRGSETDDIPSGSLIHGAECAEGVGLASPGPAHNDGYPISRGRDYPDGVRLVGPEC